MSDQETDRSVASEEELAEEEYVVEKILKKKSTGGKVLYYLKWKGYPDSENTWEPPENLDCPELIEKFEAGLKEKRKPAASKAKPGPANRKSSTVMTKTTPRKKRPASESYVEEPVLISDSDDSSGRITTKRTSKVKTTTKRAQQVKKARSASEDDDGDDDNRSNDSRDHEEFPKKSSLASDDESLLGRRKSPLNTKIDKERDLEKASNSSTVSSLGSLTRTRRETIVRNASPGSDIEKVEKNSDDETTSDENTLTSGEKQDNADDRVLENGLEPEKIIGATEISDELYFLIKWRNQNKADLISARVAKIACPQTVISFFEERLTWDEQKTMATLNCN